MMKYADRRSVRAGYNLLLLLLPAVVAGLLFSCSRAEPVKEYTVGIISYSPAHVDIIQGFMDELTGSMDPAVERIKYLYSGPLKGDTSAAQAELAKFIKKDVDLVFALTTPAARLAKKILQDTSIPLVFTPVYDPVQAKLVKHLVNHEENITGVKIGGATDKALELLLEIKPSIKRIFCPDQKGSAPSKQSLAELKKVSLVVGVDILESEVANPKELIQVLNEIPEQTDAIWLLHSPMLVSNVEVFVQAANRHKLPLATSTDLYRAGALFSYGPDSTSIGKQVGRLAYKICQGIPPAELPVETADLFLGVNMVTAQKVGVDISQEFLMKADFIIPVAPHQ